MIRIHGTILAGLCANAGLMTVNGGMTYKEMVQESNLLLQELMDQYEDEQSNETGEEETGEDSEGDESETSKQRDDVEHSDGSPCVCEGTCSKICGLSGDMCGPGCGEDSRNVKERKDSTGIKRGAGWNNWCVECGSIKPIGTRGECTKCGAVQRRNR